MTKSTKHPLSELTVIVTRPKHQAQGLCQSLEILGAKTILMPSIKIIGIEPSNALKNITQGDIAIFTSANAVTHTKALLTHLDTKAHFVAIGPSTAKALHEISNASITLPKEYSSEGILELAELKNVRGKTVYLCSGDHARPLLAKTLSERGAKVIPIISYERKAEKPEKSVLDKLHTPFDTCIISTSKEGLLNLHNTLKQEKLDWLLSQPLLISHPTHKLLAKELGFKEIICAQNPTDEEIIATLLRNNSKDR